MTITDAMVEAACEAYYRNRGADTAGLVAMRAALEAACAELIRENEALRALCESHTQLAQNLNDQNEALQNNLKLAAKTAAAHSHPTIEIWDKGNG